MLSGKTSKGIKSFSGYRSGTIVSENGTIPAGGKRTFNVALRNVLEVQYRPTHKKHLFSARRKTLLPPRMQAQFLNSPFFIASQEYCTYFLFPPFLVSSAVISSYFSRQSLLFSSPFCSRCHSQDELSLPVLPHLPLSPRLCETCSVVPGTVQYTTTLPLTLPYHIIIRKRGRRRSPVACAFLPSIYLTPLPHPS